MKGGSGDDTIHYTIGDGEDTIDGGTHTSGDTLAVLRDGRRRHARRDRRPLDDDHRRWKAATVTGIEAVTYDALAQSTGGDTLSYTGTTGAVIVNLSGTQSATGFATIAGVENVTGGSGNDTLTGDGNANVLNGGDGADTITGGLGADDDRCRGRGGHDRRLRRR